MSAASSQSGSARVPRVGDGVTPSRTFLEAQRRDGAHYRRRRLPHFEKPWAIYAVTIGTKKDRCLSPKARTIVLNSLRHFHNERYELFAACLMPDHLHLLLQPWPKGNDKNGNVVFWPLSELMHSIKSFSAHRINELEKKSGSLWEKEQFDRYVRSDRDLQEKFHYILRNPRQSRVPKQNQDYQWVWTQDDDARKESSFRRDAETSTRDACATQRRES
jgi:REP element-mobilizing transposase RayT